MRIKNFLVRDVSESSPRKTIFWWELRRLFFNIYIFGLYVAFGLNEISFSLDFFFRDGYVDETPFAFLTLVIALFAVATQLVVLLFIANFCYTILWVLDLVLANTQKSTIIFFRKNLFLFALALSILLFLAANLVIT